MAFLMAKFSKNAYAIFGSEWRDQHGRIFKKGSAYVVDNNEGDWVELQGADCNFMAPVNHLMTSEEYNKGNL